jgi:hypothetical protein
VTLTPGFGDDPTTDVPGSVPEPAMWLMMILGLGGVGSMLRVQRRKARQAFA